MNGKILRPLWDLGTSNNYMRPSQRLIVVYFIGLDQNGSPWTPELKFMQNQVLCRVLEYLEKYQYHIKGFGKKYMGN